MSAQKSASLPSDQSWYWDQVAEQKTFTHPLDEATLRELLPTSASLLDVGCGYGRVCRALRDLGYGNAVGVDTAPGMVEAGLRRYPDLDLRHLPSPSLPFADASVDGVFLIAVLTCIPDSTAQERLIADVRRVLKPGGWLHVSDYYLQHDERNRQRYQRDESEYGTYGVFAHPEGTVLRHHDPAWIERLLRPFRQRSLNERAVPTMNGNQSTIFQYWGQR